MLRQQLEELRKLQRHNRPEAYREKEGWTQVTRAAIVHGFGERNQNLTNFDFAGYAARSKNQQQDFEAVNAVHETVLASAIRELEMMLPEADAKGAYQAGDEFAFYRDLKDILTAAIKDVFIVDNYLDTEVFELYVEPIRPGVAVRILTDEVRGNLQAVATKYATRGSFELKNSKEVHDRHVFVDGRGWMIGQSIKDAAKKKPTYMVEIGVGLVAAVQEIYEGIWTRGTVVVKR